MSTIVITPSAPVAAVQIVYGRGRMTVHNGTATLEVDGHKVDVVFYYTNGDASQIHIDTDACFTQEIVDGELVITVHPDKKDFTIEDFLGVIAVSMVLGDKPSQQPSGRFTLESKHPLDLDPLEVLSSAAYSGQNGG